MSSSIPPLKASRKATGGSRARPQSPLSKGGQLSTRVDDCQTKSEHLLAFLKTLGYTPPATHTRPEHFDYLFKNEKSAQFIKALMTSVTHRNVVSKEELDAFESLDRDGLVLRGTHLARGVEQKKVLEQARSAQARQEVEKEEALKKLILEAEDEVDTLKAYQEVLQNFKDIKRRNEEALIKQHFEFRQEFDNAEIKKQVLKKQVRDKLAKLQEMKDKGSLRREERKEGGPVKSEDDDKNVWMLDWDWEGFLMREYDVHQEIEELIGTHVPSLILKSEEEELEVDPKAYDEEMQLVVNEHIGVFERLRYSLIIEEVRQLKLKQKEIAEKTALNALEACLSKAKINVRSHRGDPRVIEMQLEERISSLQCAVNDEYARLLEEVASTGAYDIDAKLNCLIESKNRAKKRLHSYLGQILTILISHKIRIDVMKQILCKETLHFAELQNRIEDINRREAVLYRKLEDADSPRNGVVEFGRNDLLSFLGFENELGMTEHEEDTTILAEATLAPDEEPFDSNEMNKRIFKAQAKAEKLMQQYDLMKQNVKTDMKSRKNVGVDVMRQEVEGLQKENERLSGQLKNTQEGQFKRVQARIEEKRRVIAEMAKVFKKVSSTLKPESASMG